MPISAQLYPATTSFRNSHNNKNKVTRAEAKTLRWWKLDTNDQWIKDGQQAAVRLLDLLQEDWIETFQDRTLPARLVTNNDKLG